MKSFHQDCVRKLRENPPSSSVVMIATVAVTVATHDLAQGVLVGVSRTHSWDITAVIAREVKARNIDMLLMGAYVHSPLRALIFGSKTTDLLRAATIPTLLLR